MKAQAKSLTLDFENRIPVSQDRIYSGPLRLKQILSNLLGNAVKFTDSGRITLSSCIQDSMVVIEISDTGPGIEPEYQQKLFRPFMQADSSTTRRFGGTGLGLALSKRLAHLLGGDLVLQNSSLGQGSTFRLNVRRDIQPNPLIDQGTTGPAAESGRDPIVHQEKN